MIQELPINIEYNKKTNDIKFTVDHGDITNLTNLKSIEVDGYDTGGQVIRTMLGLAIKTAVSLDKTIEIAPFTCSSVGKASLLYIQMAVNMIPEHSSFTVIGGNPYNVDGPQPNDFARLFEILSKIYGINLELVDDTGPWSGEMYRFKLIRRSNTIVKYTEDVIEITIDSHTANQILMSHIFFRELAISKIKLSIIEDLENDYHIDAILKIMTTLNITFTDITNDDTRTIVV